jgi:saccharopine dehydrogenase-like NADP-dependent oxidoreductase
MKNILILGAGRSSGHLIHYLLKYATIHHWSVSVGDLDPALAQNHCQNHPNARTFALIANDTQQLYNEIKQADVVVSMLPFALHPPIAAMCVELSKSMFTASYVSEAMQKLHASATQKSVLLMNEIGLDPGIDHLSAMQIIDKIQQKGGEIHSFKSYCGGLVAPESNDNPWGYKFTWNPRNVVLAGQGTVKYIENGNYKYLPYHRLFGQIQAVELGSSGSFEGYANRDSLKYRQIYGLPNLQTIFRGTLRQKGYCAAWNVLVQLGMTDDTYTMEGSKNMTKNMFIHAFLPSNITDAPNYLQQIFGNDALQKVNYLGLFDNEPLNLNQDSTPAQILQRILEPKFALRPTDKDMVVMWHEFIYNLKGKTHKTESFMVIKGESPESTAMSKTVGLPLAIGVKMYLEGKITLKGVQIPTTKEIYEPIMEELAQQGIIFTEKYTAL